MFVTAREKAMIELIIKTSGKHTAHSIAAFLHVSVRTVQRDLKNIEQILKKFELTLVKSPDKGLSISGKNEQIFKLIQTMVNIKLIDITAEERKLLLLIYLMEEKEAIKLGPLANDLGISVTTLAAYLDELSGWLNSFGIELSRKKGVGVELIAREDSKRKALASFFLMYFSEELIESIFRLNDWQAENQKVLHYFEPNYLKKAEEQVSAQNKDLKLADSAYIALIVHICITVQRHKSGFKLTDGEEDSYVREYEEYQKMQEVSKAFENAFAIQLNEAEVRYLSVIWRGSSVQAAEEFYYDSVMVGRSIKRMIQSVSEKLNLDLTSDFSLFQGLFAHMEPSLFRIKQGLASFNPLTEDIKKKYPVLYMAVSQSLEQEFSEIYFPEDEVAYIVLHFGSALELRKEDLSIRALVVCPTGIGTSKMLASRIKKEMAEISSIEIASLKEIQELNLQEYDLVISTVRLPFEQNYVLVNPLLREEDIESIRHFLGGHIQTFTRRQPYGDSGSSPVSKDVRDTETAQSLSTLLQEMEDTHTSIRMILKNLTVADRRKASSHHLLLKEMAAECETDGLLHGSDDVAEQLLARERQAGLGVPETNMALFHARHEGVKELIFRIVHSEEPYLIKGMDRNEMQARNILLLLAPLSLRPKQLEIISLISTAIVESKENMLVFSSSNEQMIRKKLEETFFTYLQNKLAKD
ncbi:transcription antiterminator [Bacillus sp. FJAT-42376]|uniref:BglG family transcription antiterminator n=1 Tax=Bacillus sp. FJAT-42376 TaxID=2014076 RepID=UPI000F4E35DC|nr:transcription antiterminator [Bacillus sp. FJAT-42376]AZB41315.1 transcription antiterminator [Bacillus sp. FJAT-42376]